MVKLSLNRTLDGRNDEQRKGFKTETSFAGKVGWLNSEL